MLRIRSFRRRVFLALLAIALVPTTLGLLAGTLLLREIGAGSGTLGPWDAVAESGSELIDAARAAAPADPAVEAAATRHGALLSESVQRSHLYTAVAEQVVHLLPVAAVLAILVLAALAAGVAGALSRSFSGPIQALVDWTGHIARHEPLPPGSPSGSGAREFEVLGSALRSMAHELDAARTREMEAARLRAWSDMSRRIAHELKNPLTPMRMSAAALARSGEATTRQAAEILLEEVDRLDEMARTFAQFGRPPEGPPAEIDLVELLERLVARHDGSPVPVRLSAEGRLPRVRGHLDALTRAFRNLVVNAQEAVQASGGTGVQVSLSAAPEGVRIVVSDDGPGIDPELLDRIWLPDVTTKRRGTGLGLALVLRTVTAHGGTASAANQPGGGAAFTVLLPLGQAPETMVPARAAAAPADEGPPDPERGQRATVDTEGEGSACAS